ncbi:hypothetical protein NMY22_g15711 [Coprinellus aureogranulatus]|nr:hypothetical protein NMY22_g15711 [Coprinellus aureogranulatus]
MEHTTYPELDADTGEENASETEGDEEWDPNWGAGTQYEDKRSPTIRFGTLSPGEQKIHDHIRWNSLEPCHRIPGAQTPAPNPAQWQSAALGLWNTYGASIMNTVRPAAAGAATGYATTPSGGQRSNPITPNKPRSSAASTPSEYFGSSSAIPSPNPPPFPTPQHFQGR